MYHRVLVDLEQDQFAGLTAERLFSWIERLGAYDGALAARVAILQEEEKKRNPSRGTLDKPGAKEIDSTGMNIAQLGGEYTAV